MDVDFVGMGMEVVNGAMDVAMGLVQGDMITLAIAAAVIILAALFMSSLESLISTTIGALFVFVVAKAGYAAFQADWDFSGPINDAWAGFGSISFFGFLMYFIVFAIVIAIVNVVKGMVAG